jgi:hypothetical protein
VIDRCGAFNEGGNVTDWCDPPRELHRLVAGKDPVDGQAFAHDPMVAWVTAGSTEPGVQDRSGSIPGGGCGRGQPGCR